MSSLLASDCRLFPQPIAYDHSYRSKRPCCYFRNRSCTFVSCLKARRPHIEVIPVLSLGDKGWKEVGQGPLLFQPEYDREMLVT